MKYLIFLALIGCMGQGNPSDGFTGSTPECLKGDVDKNGVVNRADFDRIVYYNSSYQNITPGGGTCKRWDMNDDGVLTDYDVNAIYELVR